MIGYLSDAWHQRAALSDVGHRPWPMPAGGWLMGQTWVNLLFAHWRVSEEALRAVVPPQLPIDTHDGSAWLGITPFYVRGVRLRGTVPAPLISSFPELNVRTYVSVEGKPGIYFLSLDADSWPAVPAARRTYRLPYYRGAPGQGGDDRLRPDADLPRRPAPWPLQPGWAEIETNTMAMPFGIDLEGEPLLHFSARQDVVIWPLEPAGGA
jgi:Uncharacterized conserved protein (COG2071)